jgi:hypothetical protein
MIATMHANTARSCFFSSRSDTPANKADGSAGVEMLAEDTTVGAADVDRAPSHRPISSHVQNMLLSLDNIPNDFILNILIHSLVPSLHQVWAIEQDPRSGPASVVPYCHPRESTESPCGQLPFLLFNGQDKVVQ